MLYRPMRVKRTRVLRCRTFHRHADGHPRIQQDPQTLQTCQRTSQPGAIKLRKATCQRHSSHARACFLGVPRVLIPARSRRSWAPATPNSMCHCASLGDCGSKCVRRTFKRLTATEAMLSLDARAADSSGTASPRVEYGRIRLQHAPGPPLREVVMSRRLGLLNRRIRKSKVHA